VRPDRLVNAILASIRANTTTPIIMTARPAGSVVTDLAMMLPGDQATSAATPVRRPDS
jgi:hypothetical protein